MFNHRTPMGKLWDIIRKFSQKHRYMRPLPVIMHNNEIIDDPTEVANHFGRYFSNMSSRSNYPQAFLDWERELAENLPEFGDENYEDYNKEFTMRELTDAIKRSGSTLGCFTFSKCHIASHIDVPLKCHLLTSFCVKFHFILMMFRGRAFLRLFISDFVSGRNMSSLPAN